MSKSTRILLTYHHPLSSDQILPRTDSHIVCDKLRKKLLLRWWSWPFFSPNNEETSSQVGSVLNLISSRLQTHLHDSKKIWLHFILCGVCWWLNNQHSSLLSANNGDWRGKLHKVCWTEARREYKNWQIIYKCEWDASLILVDGPLEQWSIKLMPLTSLSHDLAKGAGVAVRIGFYYIIYFGRVFCREEDE